MIGLLAVGILIGYQIQGGSFENFQKDTEWYSSSSVDDRNSWLTRISIQPDTRRPASGSSFTRIKKGVGPLSEKLLDRHSADFQRIMKTKEEEGIREFLIFLAEKNPEDALAELSQHPVLSEDLGLLLSIANGVALKNPRSAYDLITNQRGRLSSELFDSLVTSAFPAIAKSDPRFAATRIDDIADLNNKAAAMIELSEAWVNKDAREALGWLNKVMQSGASNETIERCYEKIVVGSLNENPSMVSQMVASLESSELLNRLVPSIALKMAETDLASAVEWVKSISPPDARQAGVEKIISFHAQANPESSFALVLSELNDNPFVSYPVLSSLTKHHPELMMKRFAMLPAASQPAAAECITLSMIERDGPSTGLSSWISQLPSGDVFERATEVYALNQVTHNAKNAVEFAGQLESPQARSNLLTRLVENARIDSIYQIHEALANIELESEVREHLNHKIAKRREDELTVLVFPK